MDTERHYPKCSRIRIVVRSAVIVVTLGLLVLCFTERKKGQRQLREVQGSLKSEGMLGPLSAIVPPPTAEEIANGRQFLAAIEPLQRLREAYPSIQNGPEAMRLVAPGFAISGVSGTAPFFSERADEKMPETWEVFRVDVNAGSEVNAAAAGWLMKPVAMEYDYIGNVGPKNPFGQSLQLSAWLQASALLKFHDGDLQGGIDDIYSLQRLSAFIGGPNTPVHCALEKLSVGWFVPLTWGIIQTGKANDADLARLQKLVSQTSSLEKHVASMEIEMSRLPQVYHEFDDEEWWSRIEEQKAFWVPR